MGTAQDLGAAVSTSYEQTKDSSVKQNVIKCSIIFASRRRARKITESDNRK